MDAKMSVCKPCARLKKNTQATYICTNCNEKNCEQCKTDHLKFRMTEIHVFERMTREQCGGNVNGGYFLDAAGKLGIKSVSRHSKAERGDMVIKKEVRHEEKAFLSDSEHVNEGEDDSYLNDSIIEQMKRKGNYEKCTVYKTANDVIARDHANSLNNPQKCEDTIHNVPATNLYITPVDQFKVISEDGDVQRFEVYMEDTLLARKISINSQTCTLSITPTILYICNQSHNMVGCGYTVVRKYSKSPHNTHLRIEFGRRFHYGEGSLLMRTPVAEEMFLLLRKVTRKNKQN